MMKLQSTRFEVLSGRVLSCTLGRKPYVDVGDATLEKLECGELTLIAEDTFCFDIRDCT